MAGQDSVRAYMTQWVKVATDDNVYLEWAWFQDRVTLRCRKCHAVYRCSIPDSITLEWNLQEWVKRHRNDGPHDKEEIKNPSDVVPLTADFKAVGGKIPYSTNQIDAMIKLVAEKYKASLTESSLKKKLEEIQKTGEQQKEEQTLEKKGEKYKAVIDFIESEAWQKLPTKKSLPIKIIHPFAAGDALAPPNTVPLTKWIEIPDKPKPLKIAEGRRFRP